MLKAKDLKSLLKNIPDDEEILIGANNVNLEVKYIRLSTDSKRLTFLADPDDFIDSSRYVIDKE